jgi:hypothetical protein
VAVVGDAYVVVHAITSGVKKDIERGFKGVDRVGEQVGARIGKNLNTGLAQAMTKTNSFLTPQLQRESIAAADAFSSLTRAGYVLAPAITAVLGAIGSLGSGLISLVSVVAAAGPALAVLANGFAGLIGLLATVKIGFSGVAAAIGAGLKNQQKSAANTRAIAKAEIALRRATEDLARAYKDAAASNKKALEDEEQAQKSLNKAREEAMEQLEQLAFDSEDAAINEKKAALELEKARETLARVSDLPPNSRAKKEAELAFQQADLNYRRAIDKNNDLKKTEAKNAQMGKGTIQDQIEGQDSVVSASKAAAEASRNVTQTRLDNELKLARASEDLNEQTKDLANLKMGPGFDAFQDALNNLPESAQNFVKYIVSLKGAFKDLQAAIGDELFPKLEEAIDKLVTKLLPRLKPLFAETGSVLGDVANKIADVLTRADNIERIERIWKTNNEALGIFGDTIANLIDSFLLIADAARPLVIEFANWTKNITGAWKQTLEADTKSGKLAGTLETAAEVVRRLGKLFRETFGAIGTLVKANVGPGSGGFFLLDYLTNAATKLKNLTEVDGTPLKEFFLQGAVNFTKLLDVLGGILGIIIKIGASKGMEGFLDALKGAMPDIDALGKSLADSLPAFGKFIAEFIRFVRTVTESGSITIFFNTLRIALKGVTDFLNTDFGQTLLRGAAVILPFLLALKTITQAGKFFGEVIYGNYLKVAGLLDKFPGILTKMSTAFRTATSAQALWGATMAALSSPVVIVVAAIAALIAIFVLAYKNSEILREAVSAFVKVIQDVFKGALEEIKTALKALFPGLEGVKGLFQGIGDVIGLVIMPIISLLVGRLVGTLVGAITSVIYKLAAFKDGFMTVFNFIKGIVLSVVALFTGEWDKAFKAFGDSGRSFVNMFKNIIKSIASPFVSALNGIINAWNSLSDNFKVKIPSWVPVFGGKEFSFPRIPGPINLANFADGGIVAPRPGGLIARVAEAGRPERIEPLDPDGLSKRDKAMIDYMGGAGKGITIVVNPSAGMDERELAAIVSRQLSYAMRKGAA